MKRRIIVLERKSREKDSFRKICMWRKRRIGRRVEWGSVLE